MFRVEGLGFSRAPGTDACLERLRACRVGGLRGQHDARSALRAGVESLPPLTLGHAVAVLGCGSRGIDAGPCTRLLRQRVRPRLLVGCVLTPPPLGQRCLQPQTPQSDALALAWHLELGSGRCVRRGGERLPGLMRAQERARGAAETPNPKRKTQTLSPTPYTLT